MPTLITLLLLLLSENAFQITTYDYNNPTIQESGFPNFPMALVFLSRAFRIAVNFPGYICGGWKSIKHITINFEEQVISITERIAMETTAVEYDIMGQSR